MDNCIFCKIAKKEIPKEFIYEDEDVMVFPDIHPVKPIHLLVVPKKHIVDLLDLDEPLLLEKLHNTLKIGIREKNLSELGYRTVINGGGAQEVPHLHIHLMGPIQPAQTL